MEICRIFVRLLGTKFMYVLTIYFSCYFLKIDHEIKSEKSKQVIILCIVSSAMFGG